MKRLLAILLFAFCVSQSALASFLTWNAGDIWMTDESSYSTAPYLESDVWRFGLIVGLDPTKTNLWNNVSRSGANWSLQYQAQQEKWELPFVAWANSNSTTVRHLYLANDNGGYFSNDVVQWGTNLASAPPLYWNGTGTTNEGYSGANNLFYFLGNIDNIDVRAQSRQDGSAYLSALYGTPSVPLWYQLHTNGFANGKFNPGGHPNAWQQLEMMLFQAIDLGFDTNIWTLAIDASAVTATTNNCTVTGLTKTTGTISGTFRPLRLQFAFDVPDGTVTNDCRGAFTNMPFLGMAFNCTVLVSNLPAGTYDTVFDGAIVDTCSASDYAAGRNWFTNYSTTLWKQAVAVKNAILDWQAADHVTLNLTHNGGGGDAIPGKADQNTYQGNAAANWDTPHTYRGVQYVNVMLPFVSNGWTYMGVIYSLAQPTNHSLAIVLHLSNTDGAITNASMGTVHYGL